MQTSIKKPGRNDPCSCGSGRKYKQCCLLHTEPTRQPAASALNVAQALRAGVEHQQAGRLSQAQAIYRQILETEPNNPDALHLLGLIAHQAGEVDVAIELIGRAISLNPSGLMYYNLAFSLQAKGRLDDAIVCYRQALTTSPEDARVHGNLGAALQLQGLLEEAVESYGRALALKPDDAGAHSNLGVALQALGRLGEAADSYRKALRIKPENAEAHKNLGLALEAQGDVDAAIASLNKALEIKPDYAKAYSNLIFFYAYHALQNAEKLLAYARRWEQTCLSEQDREAARARRFQRLAASGRRLRVGYVSGDYRQHATSYFVERLFAHHDRAKIEIFAYSNNDRRDGVTGRLQAMVDRWVPIARESDAAVRGRIEQDRIDVLVDLSGHTEHNRLGVFARRAAPVQAHYLGFFASTGLTEMDYWIGDAVLTPPATDDHFSEKIWRLPRVWVSYDGKADAPTPDWRPAEDGHVWLGSFNNLSKLTPATLALWAGVLRALPEAHLLLKTKELADAGNRRRILNVLSGRGVSADRVELQDSGATPDWSAHMAYYNRLDIALDPVGGLGGGTTTCDALWMGVPVIAMEGDRMASRMTASMLKAIGRGEWVAGSEAEYVDKVVDLARNVVQRRSLRIGQRALMAESPLCDARGLAASLENAYLKMFMCWFEGETRSVVDNIGERGI